MTVVQQLASCGAALLLGLPVPLGVPAASTPSASQEAPVPACTEAALDLTLEATGARLLGTARLRLPAGPAGMRALQLHPGLVPQRLALDERPVAWRREGGRILFGVPALAAPATLLVAYQGRPLERAGGATLQDVAPKLALLRPGGGWWPRPEGPQPATSLTVRLPDGWRALALVPGASFLREGRTARLTCPPGEAPALVAGPFEAVERAGVAGWAFRGAPVRVPEPLPRLLRARGLWPAAWPTWIELPPGYAPASCRDVVAAPRPPGGAAAALAALCFAPRTPELALQPERAWMVESLGAYLARLAEEGASPASLARRFETEYAAFLERLPAQDRPLLEAFGTAGEAWQALVGDKGGLAWSLVRSTLGEAAFWAWLRACRAELQTGRGGFEDLLARAPKPLGWLATWQREPGLPALRLEAVRVVTAEAGWRVSGVLAHRAGLLGVETDLVLITAEGTERVPFRTFAQKMPFEFTTRSRPLRLVIDSQERAPLVRRRHTRVREALAAPGAVVVYGTGGDAASSRAMRDAAERLVRRLTARGGAEPRLRSDVELTEEERGGDLILVGRPGLNACAAAWADQLPVRFLPAKPGDTDGKVLWWQGRTWTRPSAGVVAAMANPIDPERSVLLLAGLSPQSQLEALRFIDRSGTFCLFDEGGAAEEGLTLRAFPDLEMALY